MKRRSPRQRRRLAAIMFTDMVGFTALGQRRESLSLALVERQRKLVRTVLNRHNGREVKNMGDGFLVEFPSALDAVRCAYDIQRVTREANVALPEDRRIHLRVGVHVGDVVESRDDISGDAVNVASRIEPLAEANGVCVTRPVYESVHNKFDLPLIGMGAKQLKNVSAPVEVYRMAMPWDGSEGRGDAAGALRSLQCAWCLTPIVGEPIAYETAGGVLQFDSKDCLNTYRKLQSVHGESFR